MSQKYGSETIYINYTPVQARGISPYAGGIISGGTGGNATTTKGVQFTWVYDPDNPRITPSGFTGQGWFAETEGSPIWYSIEFCGMTLDGILAEFAGGNRENLNDVFRNWQSYVDAQGWQDKDVVQQFQQKLGWNCWSNLSGGSQ